MRSGHGDTAIDCGKKGFPLFIRIGSEGTGGRGIAFSDGPIYREPI